MILVMVPDTRHVRLDYSGLLVPTDETVVCAQLRDGQVRFQRGTGQHVQGSRINPGGARRPALRRWDAYAQPWSTLDQRHGTALLRARGIASSTDWSRTFAPGQSIMTDGPVEAAFTVYGDFANYGEAACCSSCFGPFMPVLADPAVCKTRRV